MEDPLFFVPNAVSTGAVALMASVLVMIVVSLATKPQTLDRRVEEAIEF